MFYSLVCCKFAVKCLCSLKKESKLNKEEKGLGYSTNSKIQLCCKVNYIAVLRSGSTHTVKMQKIIYTYLS